MGMISVWVLIVAAVAVAAAALWLVIGQVTRWKD